MNLLERNSKDRKQNIEENFRQDRNRENFNEEQKFEDFDQEREQDGFTGYRANREAFLFAFALLLVLLVAFGFGLRGRKENQEASVSGQVETNISEAGSDRETDISVDSTEKDALLAEEAEVTKEKADLEEQISQDVLVGKPTPIVVEGDKTHTANTDVLLKTEKMAPLDQDMAYEDYSYESGYIMKEMSSWWDTSRVTALYDLSALRRYRKLSYSLKGSNRFYYYGDTDSDGKPNGKGCAMYANDTYYFGDFVHGEREGNGYWLRFYYDTKLEESQNGLYTMHSYAGGWKNNLPDGEGQEHFDVDVTKIPEDQVVFQNVIGTFKAGMYSGDMFANSINYKEEISEWDAKAENGVFKDQDSLPPSGDHPVWVNRADENRILRIGKDENKNCGIKELLQN